MHNVKTVALSTIIVSYFVPIGVSYAAIPLVGLGQRSMTQPQSYDGDNKLLRSSREGRRKKSAALRKLLPKSEEVLAHRVERNVVF